MLERFDARALHDPASSAIEVYAAPGRCVEVMSYGALREASVRLAAQLRGKGIVAGDVIGIIAGRGLEHVVAMLAAHRLDAVFLPLEPEVPAARNHTMLERARAALSLDTRAIRRALEGDADALPDRAASAAPREGAAYLIGTSGSTGRPKLVAVGHEGLVPMLEAQIAAFGVTRSDRCGWILSPAFDASISDVGVALLAGACLCVGPPEVARDPPTLARWLREARVSYLDLPPSLLAILAPRDAPELRAVVVGGEAPPPHGVRAWCSAVRLFVVYGPTEATVCTSLVEVHPDRVWDRAWAGAPLPGVRYALIADGRETDEGELWIAGACLALGYVGDAALEAERFVVRDGVRWLRTGDRARRHADGRLELLGRIDRQVKIDGKIVAPEEVEATLARSMGVARAHVAPRGEPPRLLALVVPAPGAALDPAALRAALARELPPHLVPARIEIRSELAETPSGKVDSGKVLAVGPEDPRLAWLAGVAARALGEPVDVHDDLFERGLGSLGVVELLAAFESVGLPRTPAQLRAGRTLAACLSASGSHDDARSTASLAPWIDAWRAKVPVARRGAVAGVTPIGRVEADVPTKPRTVVVTGATRASCRFRLAIGSPAPWRRSSGLAASAWPRRRRFSRTSRCRSSAFFRTKTISSGLNGFWMKSYAPFDTASRAWSFEPYALITRKVSSGRAARAASSSLNPSSLGMRTSEMTTS
ncbi:MAG: hypothetical protein OHK0013_47550 [Sandaracinaceae bacterium]